MPEKLTAAVVGFRRPEYLVQVLNSLINCQDFGSIVDRIVVGIDDAFGQGLATRARVSSWIEENYGLSIPITSHGQPKQRGIVGNTVLTMKMAFDLGATTTLMVEDDGLLSPDALRLARWYMNLDEDYVALGLSSGSCNQEDPWRIAERNAHPCPFGYVVKRREWPFMLKNWCTKEYHPAGWSWSLSYAARLTGRKFISPALGRVFNIGRDGGTNADSSHWDNFLRLHVVSDGSYDGPYTITDAISDEEAREISPWMLNELNKVSDQHWPSGDQWPGWIGFGCPPEIEEARKKLCA